MVKLFLRLAARGLRRALSPARIEKAFQKLGPAGARQPGVPGEVCVCALQLEAKLYRSLASWLRELDAALEKAAAQGAQLVCLPELYGMTPFFFSFPIRAAARLAGRALRSPGKGGRAAESGGVYGLLAPFAFVQPAYEAILVRFASRHGVWLSGGTSFVPENGRVYNRQALFSPQGEVLARQDKIHLTPEEKALGLSAADTLSVVETPIGRIALSVCMDATYFETFRVAKRLGADYMIVPIGDMAEFSPWLAQRGAQQRVSETGLPAVKAALVSGRGFPILFTGKAGIYFPLESGLVSEESPAASGEARVLARFCPEKLRAARAGLFLRKNDAFDRRCCRELIRAAEERSKSDDSSRK